MTKMISVLQLGATDYATGLKLQQRLVELRKEGRVGDVLLLLEHTPVVTLGRNAKTTNIIASPESLAQRGVEVFECDRGGDVTFHGPGQLVGYPIFDLRGLSSGDSNRKSMGAIEYVRNLEEVLMRTCAESGIATKRICGLTGVWTDPANSGGEMCGDGLASVSPVPSVVISGGDSPQGTQRTPGADDFELVEGKVAALGVHISRGVTSHGFALNVNTDLDFFGLIVPCGIASRPVTSMAKELGREVPMQSVAESVSRNFGVVFGSQMLWVDSLEGLLSEPGDLPLRVPENLRRLHNEDDSFCV